MAVATGRLDAAKRHPRRDFRIPLRCNRAAVAILPWLPLAALAPFDHRHAAWDALLKTHVEVAADGKSPRVDDQGFAADHAALQADPRSLPAVRPGEFTGWSKPQQYAFPADAHNALTIEKPLTRCPSRQSSRDFGTVFGHPRTDQVVALLGRQQKRDGNAHETMRAAGVSTDPRVQVAVNCARAGCPMPARARPAAPSESTRTGTT